MAKLMKLSLVNALVFLFLFFLVVSNEMRMVEGKLCQKRSQTWTGICIKTQNCNNQCKNREKASSGACHRQGFGFACFCYFKKC